MRPPRAVRQFSFDVSVRLGKATGCSARDSLHSQVYVALASAEQLSRALEPLNLRGVNGVRRDEILHGIGEISIGLRQPAYCLLCAIENPLQLWSNRPDASRETAAAQLFESSHGSYRTPNRHGRMLFCKLPSVGGTHCSAWSC